MIRVINIIVMFAMFNVGSVSAQCLTDDTQLPRSLVNSEVTASCALAQLWGMMMPRGADGPEKVGEQWFSTCIIDWISQKGDADANQLPSEVKQKCTEWASLPSTKMNHRGDPTPHTYPIDINSMMIFSVYGNYIELVKKVWPNSSKTQQYNAASCALDFLRFYGPDSEETKSALLGSFDDINLHFVSGKCANLALLGDPYKPKKKK